MTAARQRGNQLHARPTARAATHLAAALLIAAGLPAFATTTERVVTDPRTGLAIGGFDPVAYFIDDAARIGRPDLEFRYRNAVWRFANPGNKAAFAADPSNYEPRLGGYDPIAIGRGAPTPGNPEIWLIAEGSLYLFYSPETKAEFAADPPRAAAQAEEKWADVLKVLAQ